MIHRELQEKRKREKLLRSNCDDIFQRINDTQCHGISIITTAKITSIHIFEWPLYITCHHSTHSTHIHPTLASIWMWKITELKFVLCVYYINFSFIFRVFCSSCRWLMRTLNVLLSTIFNTSAKGVTFRKSFKELSIKFIYVLHIVLQTTNDNFRLARETCKFYFSVFCWFFIRSFRINDAHEWNIYNTRRIRTVQPKIVIGCFV